MYLGSKILRSAAECLRTGSIKHLFFTQAKVGNFNVSLLVQQKILQLHSQRNVFHLQTVECTEDSLLIIQKSWPKYNKNWKDKESLLQERDMRAEWSDK